MSNDKRQVKRAKASAKELQKHFEKIEAVCVPLQRTLIRIAGEPSNPEIRRRVEDFQGKLSIVNGALFMLQEQSLRPGGGATQRGAEQLVRQMRAGQRKPGASSEEDSGTAPNLRGDTTAFSLPTILRFLAAQGSTGELKVQLKAEEVTLGIVSGDIVFVTTDSPRRGERIGEILIEADDVTPEHFMAFIDSYRSRGEFLGMALVENNVIEMDALTRALELQMQARLDRVLEEEECSFEFFSDAASVQTGINISVSEFLGQGSGENQGSMAPAMATPPPPAPALGVPGITRDGDSDAWSPGNSDEPVDGSNTWGGQDGGGESGDWGSYDRK